MNTKFNQLRSIFLIPRSSPFSKSSGFKKGFSAVLLHPKLIDLKRSGVPSTLASHVHSFWSKLFGLTTNYRRNYRDLKNLDNYFIFLFRGKTCLAPVVQIVTAFHLVVTIYPFPYGCPLTVSYSAQLLRSFWILLDACTRIFRMYGLLVVLTALSSRFFQ